MNPLGTYTGNTMIFLPETVEQKAVKKDYKQNKEEDQIYEKILWKTPI
ncbi:hypothetical protein DOT_4683 [Desulfosporosinus sp. OT]|nr:hypothetical protein DOT_4683 [Desulfosporosinus sp. OT]